MRKLLSWLHLWVGLVAGIAFAVLGLSGSLLVFHEDLLRWQHPQLEGQVLEPDGEVLAAILARETPRGLRSIQFPDASMPTYIGFYVDGRRGYFAPRTATCCSCAAPATTSCCGCRTCTSTSSPARPASRWSASSAGARWGCCSPGCTCGGLSAAS